MSEREFRVCIEGDEAHRGNALGHAFARQLTKLMAALSQMERAYGDLTRRQTDYEIVGARKYNPTEISFRPVPSARNYDPIPAFQWTIEQLERLATGDEVDERIDDALAETLAGLATRQRDDEYRRFWMEYSDVRIPFDDSFRDLATKVAETRRQQLAPGWTTGVSLGSVTGSLRRVSDVEGEQQFIITPAVGPPKIECRFPEQKRDDMNRLLFKTVRVYGKLHYNESSPFPFLVEMDHIESVSEASGPTHLSDLRGLFKDIPRPSTPFGEFFDV